MNIRGNTIIAKGIKTVETDDTRKISIGKSEYHTDIERRTGQLNDCVVVKSFPYEYFGKNKKTIRIGIIIV